jgi:hypothetical protein
VLNREPAIARHHESLPVPEPGGEMKGKGVQKGKRSEVKATWILLARARYDVQARVLECSVVQRASPFDPVRGPGEGRLSVHREHLA